MQKQLIPNGPYVDYYADHQRIYQFGWDSNSWLHLKTSDGPNNDWAHNEQNDYSNGNGVYAENTDAAESLFLADVPPS